ncbi:radical SAM protein [Hyalangium rubrum]|uniref:Radical SAM protein n=1 Tax=Hyalangium rubrum TaxID=3103134 RepID=A0ABU5H196_9BACT|nr:radical SAM protein [Hyalangium sp. s54d21]MDY7227225.1 radical SAM protein [Hyalangium sp. s54d21]
MGESLFHITVLSNLARAFDKYALSYSKARIPESTFPDRFFLLRREELDIGVRKAGKLLERLALPGDQLIALETQVPTEELMPNERTGLGRFVPRPEIRLTAVHGIEADGSLTAWDLEAALARSLRVLHPTLMPYEGLKPRSISFLPIARGCQADCAFCFSEASISADQAQAALSPEVVEGLLDQALARGAERAVITGGGEPGLLPLPRLVELVRACAERFPRKVVLISNGVFLSRLESEARSSALARLEEAGLTVLSLSRHHAEPARNAALMRLDTGTERVLESFRTGGFRVLKPRLIAVLQRGGLDSAESFSAYLEWAAAQGVEEVTWKELYVSTSEESVYHSRPSNRWSREHQVPLALATDWLEAQGWARVAALPWGSPVYEGEVGGRWMRVATYTEPSLFWERTQGLARSWNVLADGACYASLEDRHSRLELA